MHRPQRPGPQAPATPNRGQAILSELRRRAAESESKFWPRALSLKRGDIVRLGSRINEMFLKDQIVVMCDCEWASSRTPTRYEGQEWSGTDADTVYQCFKCEPVETFEYLIGPKSGSEGAPRHTDLSASPNVDDINASVYTEGTQAYLREDMTFPFGYRGSQKVQFKKGTRCIVMKAATRKSADAPANMPSTAVGVNRMHYRVQLKLSIYQWKITPCIARKESGTFLALPVSEVDRYNNQQLPRNGEPAGIDMLETDVIQTDV